MSDKPNVKLVVTDLDNTLYDWVAYFVPAFYEMVTTAAEILHISTDLLLDDLQAIHRRHGNSEHPFALLETEIVRKLYPNASLEERSKILDGAFLAFNRSRKQTLKLYPGIYDTLQFITSQGAALVAYTEAPSINALHRIRFLGITPFFSGVYAPKSSGVQHPNVRQTNPLDQEIRLLRPLQSGHRKPAPDVLLEICKDWQVPPTQTLYIGDSLTRDIGMAKAANTIGAWARYGTGHDPELWKKLVRVTHWTSEDVKREELLKQQFVGTKPDIELNNFAELASQIEFAPTIQLSHSMMQS